MSGVPRSKAKKHQGTDIRMIVIAVVIVALLVITIFVSLVG